MVKSPPDRRDAAELSPAAIDKQIRELVERRAEMEFENLMPLRDEYAALLDRINEAVKGYGLTAVKFLAMSPNDAQKWIRDVTSSRQLGHPLDAKPRMKVPPKYRNPANPEQTWTGRGAKPIWVRNFLDKRGKIEDLLIDKSAATKPKRPYKAADKGAKKPRSR